MSMPTIPDMNPAIGIDVDDSINMIMSSIAMQEMGLSHIINAEAEKIQYMLGTLGGEHNPNKVEQFSVEEILNVNRSVDRTLKNVLRNQMLLQMNFEESIDLYYRTRNKCESKGIRVDLDYGS